MKLRALALAATVPAALVLPAAIAAPPATAAASSCVVSVRVVPSGDIVTAHVRQTCGGQGISAWGTWANPLQRYDGPDKPNGQESIAFNPGDPQGVGPITGGYCRDNSSGADHCYTTF